MAKVVYKSYNRNDGSLFPVYLSDMVPAAHPARVIDAVVENLDIRELERTYKGGGTSSYAPRALLKVIIYAYLSNIYSGRQIEQAWRESIIYMWLGGMLIPDFRTINNFRSKRLVGTFGDIKYDHGFKRFRLRGNEKVEVEFGLVALAHNLRKYARVKSLKRPITTEPVAARLTKTCETNAA